MEQDRKKIYITLFLLILGVGAYICKLVFSKPATVEITKEHEERTTESEEEPSLQTDTAFPVYLCGAVVSPGVYEVEGSLYLYELIRMAGGLLDNADVMSIDMVYLVFEAQSIYIPSVDDSDETGKEGGFFSDISIRPKEERSGSGGELVNINTADEDELCTLPGIGPKTASDIVLYRTEHGPFLSPEEIKNVPGIGEGKYDKIRNLICV